MNVLDRAQELPAGVVRDEHPPFVPRMVMTPQLMAVVRDVVAQWNGREKFTELLKYGIRPLDRLLFFGPPGNGKTMACYWIAQQLKLPMYRVLCNELRAGVLGGSAKAVHRACEFLASQSKPAICLWDEVESIFIDRSDVGGQCDRETAAALTVFLQALDRWRAPMLLVLATNLPQQLDAALLSRVEMRLEFAGPNTEQAEQLVEYWCELLAKYGASEWGPELTAQVREAPPKSFRELQQVVAYRARAWVAKQCV